MMKRFSLIHGDGVKDHMRSRCIARIIRFPLRNGDISAKQMSIQLPIKTLIFYWEKKGEGRAVSHNNCLRFLIYALQ